MVPGHLATAVTAHLPLAVSCPPDFTSTLPLPFLPLPLRGAFSFATRTFFTFMPLQGSMGKMLHGQP